MTLTYAQIADKEGWSLQKRMENAPAQTAKQVPGTEKLGCCMRCLSSCVTVCVRDGLTLCLECAGERPKPIVIQFPQPRVAAMPKALEDKG